MPGNDYPFQLPPDVTKGITLFNTGQFYACHDALEKAWIAEKGPLRKLYQGILQIGVALYHERNGNRRGATLLLQSGLEKLDRFAPSCLGIDITAFLNEINEIHTYFQDHSSRLPETMHPHIKTNL
jgi:hypothetical protein